MPMEARTTAVIPTMVVMESSPFLSTLLVYRMLGWHHWPMGWMVLAGAGMWGVLLVCSYLHWRHPDINPNACPECGHEAGLDGPRCSEVDDLNGWSSHRCGCRHDYHWMQEFVG